MDSKAREIVMGVIACLLLLIYVFALGSVILSVLNWGPESGTYVANSNLGWVVNLLGGVISAVVIGNLALSSPGQAPVEQVRAMSLSYGKNMMKTMVWIYIGVWIFLGLATFYVGVIKCPDVYGTLNEMGKLWLGVLAGALYAWFGINKK
jgi:hypothetical protein